MSVFLSAQLRCHRKAGRFLESFFLAAEAEWNQALSLVRGSLPPIAFAAGQPFPPTRRLLLRPRKVTCLCLTHGKLLKLVLKPAFL